MGKNCPNCGKHRWGLVAVFRMQGRSQTCPTCGIPVMARCPGPVRALAVLGAMVLPAPFLVVSAMLLANVVVWILLWTAICLGIYATIAALGSKLVAA